MLSLALPPVTTADPDQLAAVAYLRSQGRSAERIARALNLSRATVYRRFDELDRLRTRAGAAGDDSR